MTSDTTATHPAGFRERHHKAIWALLWPVRLWFTRSPIHRGKGAIYRRIILPALPPAPAAFDYRFSGDLHVPLRYRESLGTIVLFGGRYEDREIAELCRHVVPGSTVFDVGANIGLSALELARATGPSGRVIAFEPDPSTKARLEANLALNRVGNVSIEQSAVSDHVGTITFYESGEPTFSSASLVPRDFKRSFEVPVTTVDAAWQGLAQPHVSALKVDVEGGELQVLRGSAAVLARDKPAVLLEAWGPEQLDPIEAFLSRLGYERHQPDGFEPRNYLYLAGAAQP